MYTQIAIADYEKDKSLLTKLLVEEVMPLLGNALSGKKDMSRLLTETTDYLISKGVKLPEHTIVNCMIESNPHHHDSRDKTRDLLVVGGCAHPIYYRTTISKYRPTADGHGMYVSETVWGFFCG